MCKNDTGAVVIKSELQQSVITTIASSNKILVNSLNEGIFNLDSLYFGNCI